MAFSQSGISGVDVQADGPELFISWTSAAPRGTFFQVYADGRLAWYGTVRRCYVPIPAGASGRNVWVDVGTVDPGESRTDFSAGLASQSQGGPLVRLSWPGGTYLDPSGFDDVQGFWIYRGDAPGAPVDLSAPVGDVPAYPGGWVCDGFGLGGFGPGGFGRSAGAYAWTSAGLAGGVWQFAVVPYDHQGNARGAGQTVSVTVAAAPLPPAAAAGRPAADVYLFRTRHPAGHSELAAQSFLERFPLFVFRSPVGPALPAGFTLGRQSRPYGITSHFHG